MSVKGVSKNGNSFVARIYRGGKETSRSFAFKDYGGEIGAYEAAVKAVEEMERLVPPVEKKKGKKTVYKTHTNNGSGYPIACFKVMWREFSIQRSRTFTFQEGDDQSEAEAKKKADGFAK
jgi:hypothetical protein